MYQSKSLGSKLPRDLSAHRFACPSPETVHWYEVCPKMTSCTFLKALLRAIFTPQLTAQASAGSRGRGVIQSHLGSGRDIAGKGGSKSQILGGDSAALSVHWANAEITAGHDVPEACRQAGGALPSPAASALPKTAQLQGWSWVLLSSTALLYRGAPRLPGERRGLPCGAVPAVAGVGHVELAHEVDGSQGAAAPRQALGHPLPLDLVILGRQRAAPSRAGGRPRASKQSCKQPKIAPGCSGSTSAAG